jgi:multidrug efflux pump
MVFLILAAQYERWTLPIAVITAVPFAVFGAILAIWLRGIENDIYFQVGLVTLVGLAAKNAILIVEFASERHRAGVPAFDAALEAARLRFRPIVMTSLASSWASCRSRSAPAPARPAATPVGTGVIGGMLAATFLATFLVPMFFRLVTRDRKERAGGEVRGGVAAAAAPRET